MDHEVAVAGYDSFRRFRAIAALGSKPWATVASHLHDGCVSMNELAQVARSKRLALVEDATQAQGVVIQGRMAGASGDIGISSCCGSKLTIAGRGRLSSDHSHCCSEI